MNQKQEWLSSLQKGAEVWETNFGKMLFRELRDERVYLCKEEHSLHSGDESFLFCHGLMHTFHPSSVHKSAQERLKALATSPLLALEAIAAEAKHHQKRLAQMSFWLEYPEIKEFQLFQTYEVDGEETSFKLLQLNEGYDLETTLDRLTEEINFDDWFLEEGQEPVTTDLLHSMEVDYHFEASEPLKEPLTYLRPSAEEIEDYILKRQSMIYRNFSRNVCASPTYSFMED